MLTPDQRAGVVLLGAFLSFVWGLHTYGFLEGVMMAWLGLAVGVLVVYAGYKVTASRRESPDYIVVPHEDD